MKQSVIADVMKAILHLKDSKGSSLKKIEDVMNRKYPSADIKQALRFGLHNGLIKMDRGSFKLGVDLGQLIKRAADDVVVDISSKIYDAKRRRSKKKSRRRRRRRDDDITDSHDGSGTSLNHRGVPVKEHRRRRNRNRRRSRRRRRRSADQSETTVTSVEADSCSVVEATSESGGERHQQMKQITQENNYEKYANSDESKPDRE